MSELLVRTLGLDTQDKARSNAFINKVKGMATFFKDAIDAGEKVGILEGLQKACPWWLEAIGSSFAQSVPVIKFFTTLFAEMTKETEPGALGFLACTVAYQKAVVEVLTESQFLSVAKTRQSKSKLDFSSLDFQDVPDFKTFTIMNSSEHEFCEKAGIMFKAYLRELGASTQDQTALQQLVNNKFRTNLKLILSNGKTAEKFKPFKDFLDFGPGELCDDYLISHVAFTRWQFEEAKLFQQEPYSLADIYLDAECGVLKWGDVRPNPGAQSRGAGNQTPAKDPFIETNGGREPLLEAVLSQIATKELSDFIIVQGVAGSGKSSFTLKLATELAKYGFLPLRIRLRDLGLDRHVQEAIPRALFPNDVDIPDEYRPQIVEDPFQKNSIFGRKIDFRGTTLCPFVIILDGWDEISVSAVEGFQVRVERMLEQVRNTFLNGYSGRVRVVVTGRPTAALEGCTILSSDSPLLTIRPLAPDALRRYAGRVADVLGEAKSAARVAKAEFDSNESVIAWEPWALPARADMEPVFAEYDSEFNKFLNRTPENRNIDAGPMEVLGLPLLAYLAFQLFSRHSGDFLELVRNPTTLLRGMADLTCDTAAKDKRTDLQQLNMYSGLELRRLLHRTAVAMTVYGEESIPYEELRLRLKFKKDDDLAQTVSDLSSRLPLSSLLVAFFFKGGKKHLGCEFLHKSFREFLFAEAIVEKVKQYGRLVKGALPERTPYWKDFEGYRNEKKEIYKRGNDARYDFSRDLAEALAPQWLSKEIVSHLESLFDWEICIRTDVPTSATNRVGSSMLEPISLPQWAVARDGLADLWDWWGEGVHLRPQPEEDENTQTIKPRPCYAEHLIREDQPFDTQSPRKFVPPRTTTVDAHLGDALFRLNCWTHFFMAKATGWLEGDRANTESYVRSLWPDSISDSAHPKPYQTLQSSARGTWIHFRPGGNELVYLEQYRLRIDSAAWRPAGPFPMGIDLTGTDLSGARFSPGHRYTDKLSDWSYCNLDSFFGTTGTFAGCFFHYCKMADSYFEGTHLIRSELRKCWGPVSFRFANLLECNITDNFFAQIQPTRVRFSECFLWQDGRKTKIADGLFEVGGGATPPVISAAGPVTSA